MICSLYSYFHLQDPSVDPMSTPQNSILVSHDDSLEDPFDENKDVFDPVQDDAGVFVEVDEGDENELGQDELHPNNNFCFIGADFLEAVSNINTVSKCHKVRSDACNKIHELVGKEIEVKSIKKDGSIKWKVVPVVFDDEFTKRREQEESLFKSPYIPLLGCQQESYINEYSKMFWHLIPSKVDKDLVLLNEIIAEDNLKRREKFQRLTRFAH